ncbi:MAG: DUF4244 domain-containing protein [Actinomycetaceae bacterium]|nr:DUF4244 domain-containing protein [Arcanobacterium sp.]MDD7687599.1 DUF4244 domain-containing protein [Actinomycetaceae bacterium]MDY5273163.1 DUF4244 domain-containing protein [Arcanobacterium sp.]
MKKKMTPSKVLAVFTKRGHAAEDGMVTAEYALGTVATTGIAGILIWLSQQEWLRELIADIFRRIVAG